MTEITAYAAGTPCWADLTTPDPQAAQAFYAALFGWGFEEPSADDESDYTMCLLRGKPVAGLQQLTEPMQAGGMPPVWASYVAVDDAATTATTAASAGGRIFLPPRQVARAGTMAIIIDSTGAVLCLWQADQHAGAALAGEHGTVCWTELMTHDVAAAASFYAEVLGWSATTVPMPTGDYTIFNTPGGDERGVAGAMPPPVEMPAAWGVYFQVDDLAATCALATSSGAAVLFGPSVVPGVGTIATVADPQGAVFSLLQPDPMG